MHLGQFKASSVAGEFLALVSKSQVGVIDFAQLLVGNVIEEELLLASDTILIKDDFRLGRSLVLHGGMETLRNETWVPSDEVLVTIQVTTSNLVGDGNFAFFGEDNTIEDVLKLLGVGVNGSHRFDIAWMQARVSSDHYFSFHHLFKLRISFLFIKIIFNQILKIKILEKAITLQSSKVLFSEYRTKISPSFRTLCSSITPMRRALSLT
jgi:hypothetical protein